MNPYKNQKKKNSKVFETRDRDWRMGGLLYQVFVDRFVPSNHLNKKKHLYVAPKSLKSWQELPSPGVKDKTTSYYTHELAFWGGDLQSLMTKLDYIKQWGFTTLYLNPIFEAFTNHKYDTINYEKISPEYGTMDDLQLLIQKAHAQKLRLMLDGVFNHMALSAPIFQDALKNPTSPYRTWFDFKENYPKGYRVWANVASLVELNLQNASVRDYLFNQKQSIVQRYLKMGIDGWRLDTAIELGYEYLYELTEAAHQAREDAVVIGELLQYPEGWSPAMDGVMQLALRDLIFELIEHRISGPLFGQHIATMIEKTGIETMLRSWILLENHDSVRIKNRLPSWEDYQLAKALQFTLPGTVNIYQGEELGIAGDGDPYNRAPMQWDLYSEKNPYVQLHRQWIQLRQQERALRIGDYVPIHTEKLYAFMRTTDKIRETIVVLINPTLTDVEETIIFPIGTLKSHLHWTNLLHPHDKIRSQHAFLTVRVPKQTTLLLKPIIETVDGYSPYKNIEKE